MSSSRGYSVFEVLIAFAIMSLVLSALIPGQARLLARASSGDQELLALDYAQSRLAQLGVSEPLEPGLLEYRDGSLLARIRVRESDVENVVGIEIVVFDENDNELATLRSERTRE